MSVCFEWFTSVESTTRTISPLSLPSLSFFLVLTEVRSTPPLPRHTQRGFELLALPRAFWLVATQLSVFCTQTVRHGGGTTHGGGGWMGTASLIPGMFYYSHLWSTNRQRPLANRVVGYGRAEKATAKKTVYASRQLKVVTQHMGLGYRVCEPY